MPLIFNTNVFGLIKLISSFINRLNHKKNGLNIYLQILFMIFAASCSNQLLAKPIKVMMFGDSISAGYGMQLNQSWPHLLNETFINEQQPIQIINESISGETTGGGLARLPEVLKRQQLGSNDWLIIELGGNDGLRGFPVKTVKQNLTKMIQIAQYQGINVALMQIRIPPNYGRRYTSMFEQQYPKLTQQFNIPLLPFFMEKIAINPEYMQKDNLHPNISAQVVIRDIMKPEIEQLVGF